MIICCKFHQTSSFFLSKIDQFHSSIRNKEIFLPIILGTYAEFESNSLINYWLPNGKGCKLSMTDGRMDKRTSNVKR